MKAEAATARCKQLARRTVFDLSLLHDAGVSSGLAFSSLARVKRARFEMNNLLREISYSEPASDNNSLIIRRDEREATR